MTTDISSIKHQCFSSRWMSRERQWLDRYADTHWTIGQAAKAYRTTVAKLNLVMPPHDLKCPHGSRTRLWRREAVIARLGEPPC